MAAATTTLYAIDTSSFVYCQRSFGSRPSQVAFYAAVWALLDRLADERRLVEPRQVFIEITKNKDMIGVWAENHEWIFQAKGQNAALVPEILTEPGQRLVDPAGARGSEEADPWVIAAAEAASAVSPTLFDPIPRCLVVSEELKPGGIAEICRRRGIGHIDFVGLLAAEGLSLS
jgi:hypothetical protein